MATVNVVGSQLKWARTFRQLTTKQAAKLLDIPVKQLLELEDDKRQPNLTTIRRISKTYSIPIATLVLPLPPKYIPKEPESFRTLLGRPQELSHKTLSMISRIRSYQDQLIELIEIDSSFQTPVIKQIQQRGNATKLGETERARLAITIEEQIDWYDPEEAFRSWRKIIEKQGICVYMEDWPILDSRGISLFDHPKVPSIIINKNEILSVAKIFSLIHEYAHIILRKPGLSDRDDRNSIERFCNQFAAGFLVPQSALKKMIRPWPDEPFEWKANDIKHFAKTLHISQQVMALRLEDVRIAPDGFYNEFIKKQPRVAIKKKKVSGFPPYAIRRIYALGRRFPTAVISATDKGLISPAKATNILNTPIQNFNDMRLRLNLI